MIIVEASDLTKIYASRKGSRVITALEGLSIAVHQGEVYGLLGPDGAGKTTLFRALLGLVKLDAGEIYINGLNSSNPLSRGKIGFFSGKPQFPAHLNARQLLSLAGRLFGLKESVIRERSGKLLEQFDLNRWPNLKIKNFSKALVQKVSLAQAMISDPDVLILDEPFAGLDERHKAELFKLISEIRTEAKTIILSSHQRSDVETLADRIGVIKKGKIIRTIDNAALQEQKCMYEIEAAIGQIIFEVPAEIGQKIKISTSNVIVEVTRPELINNVIDEMRLKKINIISVKPMRTKLEQSLYDGIENPKDDVPSIPEHMPLTAVNA